MAKNSKSKGKSSRSASGERASGAWTSQERTSQERASHESSRDATSGFVLPPLIDLLASDDVSPEERTRRFLKALMSAYLEFEKSTPTQRSFLAAQRELLDAYLLTAEGLLRNAPPSPRCLRRLRRRDYQCL